MNPDTGQRMRDLRRLAAEPETMRTNVRGPHGEMYTVEAEWMSAQVARAEPEPYTNKPYPKAPNRHERRKDAKLLRPKAQPQPKRKKRKR
jgi:hypothetical protein